MRADITAGVVGHVDGVSAGSLHGESRCWVRWRERKKTDRKESLKRISRTLKSGSRMTFTDLSVHAGNRAARHAVGDAPPHIDFVAQQVFEAPVTELEELVRVSSPS